MTTVNRNTTVRLDSVTRRPGTGYLDCLCIGTRIGVFEYYDKETGQIRRELRHPDDVFHPDSIASMANIPFTNDHPPVMLDSTNTDQYQRGYLYGNPYKIEDVHLASRLLITHEGTIRDYDAGKRDVSMGYTCVLIFEPDTWNGQPYDFRQTEIRYNHVSLVHRGRAGPTCRVRTDGLAVTVQIFDSYELPKKEPRPMAKIRLDNGEIEADDAIAAAVNLELAARKQAFDTLKTQFDTVSGEKIALEASNKQLKQKVDAFQNVDLNDLAREFAQAMEKAKPFLPADFKADSCKTPVDVMRAGLMAAHTDQAEEYKAASEDFIRGAFKHLDAAPPATKTTPSAAFSAGQAAGRSDAAPPAGSQPREDADEGAKAYKEMTGA